MFTTRRGPLFLLALLLLPVGLAQQGEFSPGPAGNAFTRAAASFRAPVQRLRTLPERGVALQSLYVHDLSQAPIGAPGDHTWFGRYSWDVSATLDGEKLAGWRGGSAFLHGKQHLQEFGRMYDGVAQGYSNIDAASGTMLYEAWGQQLLLDKRVRLQAGKIDANTEFDTVATAADFLNSSMGFSPTIMEFPTYPAPQLGGVVAVAAGPSTQISAGEFVTASGKMTVAEAAQSWSGGKDGRGGRACFGVWDLRAPLPRFRGGVVAGSHGSYAVLEQSIWRRALTEASPQGLTSFLQIGSGNGEENPYAWHVGGGAVLTAPLRRRPADAVGAAATWVRFSGAPHAGFDAHSELAVETYYKIRLTRTTALVWDTQYFRHPGGIRGRPETVIVTPRLVVSF